MIIEVEGNILDSEATYIAHQCNCISTDYSGLAKSMFEKFPWSQTYSKRPNTMGSTRGGQHVPGTIEILGDGSDKRFVVNMYAQLCPGPPKPHLPGRINNDSKKDRLSYFSSCLTHMKNIDKPYSVAFPYGIGCGLAHGDWSDYKQMIEDFANNEDGISVYIVKYNGPEIDKRPRC